MENSIWLGEFRMYLGVEREQGLKPVGIRCGRELKPDQKIHDRKVIVSPRCCWQGEFPWRLRGVHNDGAGRLVRRRVIIPEVTLKVGTAYFPTGPKVRPREGRSRDWLGKERPRS